jgi:hypothetical protein
VLVNRWGVLTTSGYTAQPPRDPRVETAWDCLSELCSLDGQKERRLPFGQLWLKLSAEPYGYNELTFVALLGAWLTYHRREVHIAVRTRKSDGTPQTTETSLRLFVAPDSGFDRAFGKPKDFLNFFTNNDAAFLIRREPLTDVVVPEEVNADEVPALVSKIAEYQSLDGVDKSKAADLKRKRLALEEGAAAIESWIGPIRQAVASNLPTGIPELVLRYSAVVATPPELDEDVTVRPTQAHSDEQFRAIGTVRAAIEAAVKVQAARASALASDADFNAFLGQLGRDQEACQQVPDLAGAFESNFQQIQLAAQRRREQLVRAQRLRDCVESIERLTASLNTNSSESAVARARLDLAEAVAAVPDVGASERFRQATAKIDGYENALTSTLAGWRQRTDRINTSREAERLRDEIVARQERYDSDASRGVVSALTAKLDRLAEELLQNEGLDRVSRRCLELAGTLAAQIRAVPDVHTSLKLYDDLRQTLTGMPSASPAERRAEAERLETAGRAAVVQKLEALCTKRPGSLSELTGVERVLSELKTALASREEFAATALKVNIGLTALEEARASLGARDDDRRIMDIIRRIKPETANSVARCRQQLAELSDLQKQLHDPAEEAEEIGRVRGALERRVQGYAGQLDQIRQRLQLVTSTAKLADLQRSYNQLDFVFRGSELEPAYATVDTTLAGIADDLAIVAELETSARSAHSVVTCNAVIDLANKKQSELHAGERFAAALVAICDRMASQVEGYRQQLEQHRVTLAAAESRGAAEKAWEAVVAASPRFAGSDSDEAYQALRSEADLVVSFLRIYTPAPQLHTKEACEAALGAIERWRSDNPTLPGALLERAAAYDSCVRATLADLTAARRQQAATWLCALAEAARTLSARREGTDRARDAARLLNRLSEETNSEKLWLDEAALGQLQEVEQCCRELVDSDREAQVFALLGQLPVEKQAAICQKLAAALHWDIVVGEVAMVGE